jgi:hypothetical protein
MARGHDSMAAVLIYQHASREADELIAAHGVADGGHITGRRRWKAAGALWGKRAMARECTRAQWAVSLTDARPRRCADGLALVYERVTRIELALSAWEADVLPLNYTRATPRRTPRRAGSILTSPFLAGHSAADGRPRLRG